jgi:hypothetical protein
MRQRERCSLASGSSVLGLRVGVLRSIERVKGWRLFLIADARAPFRPTLAAASCRSVRREPRVRGSRATRAGIGTSRIKTGRSIRCPACDTPASPSSIRGRA